MIDDVNNGVFIAIAIVVPLTLACCMITMVLGGLTLLIST